MAGAPTLRACDAWTLRGEPCTRPARYGSDRCWQHQQPAPSAPSADTGAERLSSLLQRITDNGGPGGLDLARTDLSDLDLSQEALQDEWVEWLALHPNEPALWLVERFGKLGLNLIGANLEHAYLVRTNLSYARMQLANLRGADLYGANLFGADLYHANLAGASLYRANLNDTKLERADLTGSDLRVATLQGANLLRADLGAALIQRDAIGAAVLQEDSGSYVRYIADDRRILDFGLATRPSPSHARSHLYPLYGQQWRPLPDEQQVTKGHISARLIEAREIYRTLHACFAQQGRTDDASWAHLKEREIRRRSFFPTTARSAYAGEWPSDDARGPSQLLRRCAFYVKYFAKWVVEVLYKGTSEYGERPSRVFMTLGAAWLMFCLLVWAFGSLTPSCNRPDPLRAALFSLASLVSMQFPDTAPCNVLTEVLSVAEAAIGLSLFALLLLTLGNRMSKT